MKFASIEIGERYLVRSPANPGQRGAIARAVVVLEKVEGTVVVETTEMVCTNLEDFPACQQASAMIHGQLRYEPRPKLLRVRARDVLRPHDVRDEPELHVDEIALDIDAAVGVEKHEAPVLAHRGLRK